MPVLINECLDYPIEKENDLKLFPLTKNFSKTSDSLTDDILNEVKTQTDSIFFTEKDLKFMDITSTVQETKLSNNLKTEKPAATTNPAKVDKQFKSSDSAKITKVSKTDEKYKNIDMLKMEKEIKQEIKKLQTPVEKETKICIDASKKVNKVAPLHLEKSEEKKIFVDKKFKDLSAKILLSDNQIHLEDIKKKSFAQNNGRKYGLTNEEVKNVRNKGNDYSKSKNHPSNRNVKDDKEIRKKVEQTSSPLLDMNKSKQKKVHNHIEENMVVKKTIDKRTGKIISMPKPATENGFNNLDNRKKAPKYTNTGLTELRKWRRKDGIEAVVEEPELVVEKPDPNKNKKGTNVKPFSFEVREIEFLKKKEMLTKMGEEKKYEIKKWARSPEVLKKKPFSVQTTKRYILPDLYKLKLKTEERIKKRPKFDVIVEQKQKTHKEQELIKHMAEVKELRKSQIPSPTPIPENVKRLLEEAKKLRSEVSSEISDSVEDMFDDLKYNDRTVNNTDAGSPIPNENEHQINSPDELKHEADEGKELKLEIQYENISNDTSSDEEEAILSSEENEPTEAKDIISDDTSSSAESTTKYTPYNLLISAFKKKYSS